MSQEYADHLEEEWNREADRADWEAEHGMTVEEAKQRAAEDQIDRQLEREAFEI